MRFTAFIYVMVATFATLSICAPVEDIAGRHILTAEEIEGDIAVRKAPLGNIA
jgi:hypothetical protein